MARSLVALDEVAVTRRRVRAYIGLGANLGDAAATLADAVVALAGLPGTTVRGVSRLYVTAPVGVTDQPDFHNAVVALDVPAGPDPATGALELLAALKGLERAFGRQKRRRWGPRELDLDLLVFGRARLSVERTDAARSVDAETDPATTGRRPTRCGIPPGWGISVETARRRQAALESSDAVRAIAAWDVAARRWRPIQPR